ncbi:hypothetical protein [Sphingobium yanoikuyae]|uniref:hypothetical protein n=1 Tax=Sphingobium yanoikuyae TaxID=13690 RepID=UPI0012376963|nr:hypothetical protein [Sphingobium yanoikuyae]
MVEDDAFLEDHQSRARCIRCGDEKFQPYHRCESCRFEPQNDDLVKSVYLSVWRYEDADKQAHWAEALKVLTKDEIVHFTFASEEMKRLHTFVGDLVKTGGRHFWFVGIPLIAAIMGLTWAVFAKTF